MRDGPANSRSSAEEPGRAWSLILISALAVAGAVGLSLMESPRREGVQFWTFAPPLRDLYQPFVADWNAREQTPIQMTLMSQQAMERRMLAAFFSGTPFADVVEAERANVGRAFRGPPESIGFLDLTDRIREAGLDQSINAPSFSPWMSRGRIYGIPHDVHPVMLGYRADIVEAAGIDVGQIETWDDYFRVMAPLMTPGPDGRPVRYLLNLWPTHQSTIELLLLQAGAGLFDENGRCVVNSPVNAEVLAKIAGWCAGPSRVTADAPYFSASGNQLLLEGYVVASFVPDWMCNIWKREIPQLAGRVKLMALPAWTTGGRRTSVWGGTMLGIPKTASDQDAAWEFAKWLYTSPELARATYKTADIVTPVKSLWDDPVFDEPDPYFSNQRKGKDYIRLAPDVPIRSGSPFNAYAQFRVQDALIELVQRAQSASRYDHAWLVEQAQRLLDEGADLVREQMSRDAFSEVGVASSGEGVP